MNSMVVFQKEWAFTSSESSKPIIRTGAFGPCHVVTFTSGKFAALAHIDEFTYIGSIQTILDRFLKNSIQPKNIKVTIMGGWKKDEISRFWGKKIFSYILKYPFKEINVSQLFRKKERSDSEYFVELSEKETSEYYFLGALVDSTTGKTFVSTKEDLLLSQAQLKISKEIDTDELCLLKETSESRQANNFLP